MRRDIMQEPQTETGRAGGQISRYNVPLPSRNATATELRFLSQALLTSDHGNYQPIGKPHSRQASLDTAEKPRQTFGGCSREHLGGGARRVKPATETHLTTEFRAGAVEEI